MANKKRKRKPTALQLEYKKQVDRLRKAQRRIEKRGYTFLQDLVPKKPKRITRKQVQKLAEITKEKVYEHAVVINTETGEFISGKEALKLERSYSAKKAALTRKRKKEHYETFPAEEDIIISNFRADASRFPEVAYPLIIKWLDRVIRDYGKKEVANIIKEAESMGLGITYSIAYREDLLIDRLGEIMDLIPDASVGNKQEIIEALEYYENWEEPE